VDKILQRGDVELAFVWNRTQSAMEGKIDPAFILDNLEDFTTRFFFLLR
jgi:hypothetical protein